MWKPARYLILLLPLFVSANATVPISVFVSIPPQKQFVEKIGGQRVDVQVMLPAGQSPETYSPSPQMLTALSAADVYFQIGVPFEASWTDAIRSANSTIRIAECCGWITNAGPVDAAHNHEDLHIWSSPAQVRILAQLIRDELSAIDPEHRDSFETGYRQFIAELDTLDAAIRNRLASRRIDHFIVSHAAWGYFAEQYGLVQHALENNGKESGPRALLDIVQLARDQKIDTVFAVAQYRTPVAASLALELNARVVELDPLAADYLRNMEVVSAQIAEALR